MISNTFHSIGSAAPAVPAAILFTTMSGAEKSSANAESGSSSLSTGFLARAASKDNPNLKGIQGYNHGGINE